MTEPIKKMTTFFPVSREMLEPPRIPYPEEVRRRAAEHAAQRAREDARHDELLKSAVPVVAAIAGLHSPNDCRECGGCDFDGFEAERPEWPCRTWTLLDETVGVA